MYKLVLTIYFFIFFAVVTGVGAPAVINTASDKKQQYEKLIRLLFVNIYDYLVEYEKKYSRELSDSEKKMLGHLTADAMRDMNRQTSIEQNGKSSVIYGSDYYTQFYLDFTHNQYMFDLLDGQPLRSAVFFKGYSLEYLERNENHKRQISFPPKVNTYGGVKNYPKWNIYFNLNIINENTQLRVPELMAMLVHEIGHVIDPEYNIKDQAAIDSLAAKVAADISKDMKILKFKNQDYMLINLKDDKFEFTEIKNHKYMAAEKKKTFLFLRMTNNGVENLTDELTDVISNKLINSLDVNSPINNMNEKYESSFTLDSFFIENNKLVIDVNQKYKFESYYKNLNLNREATVRINAGDIKDTIEVVNGDTFVGGKKIERKMLDSNKINNLTYEVVNNELIFKSQFQLEDIEIKKIYAFLSLNEKDDLLLEGKLNHNFYEFRMDLKESVHSKIDINLDYFLINESLVLKPKHLVNIKHKSRLPRSKTQSDLSLEKMDYEIVEKDEKKSTVLRFWVQSLAQIENVKLEIVRKIFNYNTRSINEAIRQSQQMRWGYSEITPKDHEYLIRKTDTFIFSSEDFKQIPMKNGFLLELPIEYLQEKKSPHSFGFRQKISAFYTVNERVTAYGSKEGDTFFITGLHVLNKNFQSKSFSVAETIYYKYYPTSSIARSCSDLFLSSSKVIQNHITKESVKSAREYVESFR